MTPITGPYNRNVFGPWSDKTQTWFRQRPPYDLPLFFQSNFSYGVHSFTFSDGESVTVKEATLGSSSFPDYEAILISNYNRAYETFRGQISDTAGWAENLAQINKTRLGVVTRAVQLSQFVLALRGRRFKDASRILRYPKPSSVSERKNVAQNFLEWEYGVKPIISDLQSSLRILTDTDFGVRKLRARSSSDLPRIIRNETIVTGGETSRYIDAGSAVVFHTIRAQARISNPNLFLANQLGILDVALPWKLIPFSFVVDWFINVEQVMSSMTDFIGVSLQNPHVTYFSRGVRKSSVFSSNALGEWSRASRDQLYVECRRTTGIPGPTLTVKPFRGFSIQRGAQAIALVIATLGK